VTIAPGATGEDTSYLFAGAKVESIIDGYEKAYGFDRLELLIDWGWFHFLTKPMFYLIRVRCTAFWAISASPFSPSR
jgi:YidC/Oxa1 family membrane protein insertase